MISAYSLEDGLTTNQRFRQVYQRTFKIYRGVDNILDFMVRNQDQKTIVIADRYAVLNILNNETRELILSKEGEFDGSSVGKVRFTLSESELLDIEPGYYKFTLRLEDRTYIDSVDYVVNSSTLLYVDSQFSADSTIEILGDISGEPKDSLEIKEFTREWNADANEDDVFYSSIIDAKPEISRPSSIHTFAFYSSSYDGSVKIQGNLDPGSSPTNWVDLLEFTPSSNVEYKNITGKYNWLRIQHQPSQGTLDKILYRS